MDETKKKSVVIFYSTSAAIRTESLAKKQQLEVKLIPVPRHLSSDCGICLSFYTADLDKIKEILNKNTIEFAAIHSL
jgi:hypothetical protein